MFEDHLFGLLDAEKFSIAALIRLVDLRMQTLPTLESTVARTSDGLPSEWLDAAFEALYDHIIVARYEVESSAVSAFSSASENPVQLSAAISAAKQSSAG